MPYSSSLTDKEWELRRAITASKEANQTTSLDEKTHPGWHLLSTENGCNWCDLPKDLPPYSTVFWYYKQCRADGVLDRIMATLHANVRQQVKKNQSGQGC
jgi:transposase